MKPTPDNSHRVTVTSPMNRGLKVDRWTRSYGDRSKLQLLPRWIGDWKLPHENHKEQNQLVTVTSPMNRGLKETVCPAFGCRDCRLQLLPRWIGDWKLCGLAKQVVSDLLQLLPRWIGDWKSNILSLTGIDAGVTVTSPMNRGLKVQRLLLTWNDTDSYSYFPDE